MTSITAAAKTHQAPRARLRLGSLGEAALVVLSIAAVLGIWELLSRTGLISETDLPSMSATVGELWSSSPIRARSGATCSTRSAAGRSGSRSRPCSPSRSGSCSAPATSPASAFRVPIEFLRPIPSAVADPAALPHPRHDARRARSSSPPSAPSGRCSCRRCTACATSTRCDRHGALVRRRPVRAPLADHAAERTPVHRHRPAHLLHGLADPRVHRGALHGHAGPRPGDELRELRTG